MKSAVRVAAVITTYNRRDLLRRSLNALLAQTRPVDEIIVVDNSSTDHTVEMVRDEFPSVRLIPLTTNTGAAGGFAEGLREVAKSGHDWAWVFNDDDMAAPDALDRMLRALSGLPRTCGILASGRCDGDGTRHPLGARWHHRQRTIPWDAYDARPLSVDVIAFSGTLVSVDLVAEVGLPKVEFFMMVEELDYCLRSKDAGWQIYVVPEVLTISLTLGSKGTSSPWRAYYQTRNHLAMALNRRSMGDLFWWAVRTAKLCGGAIHSGDQRMERIRLRLLGTWHALRGITGQQIAQASSGSQRI